MAFSSLNRLSHSLWSIRQNTNDPTPFIECAINHIASDIGDNEVVIVMTGDQSVMDDSVELLDIMEGSQELHPRVHLQDILMDIPQRTDKIYETVWL